MLELRTMGAVDLRSDGRELTSVLVQPKRFALLVYLVLANPRALHRRDNLLAIFWPEMNQSRARHALRQALHFLRQSIGTDVLQTRGNEEVGINTSMIECDLLRFEECIECGDLRGAVPLHAGPFLHGFAANQMPDFEHWVDTMRARVDESHVGVLEQLAADAMRENKAQEAVQWWRRLSVHDPFRPGFALGLMQSLVDSGDRKGALRHFAAHAKVLEIEFGAEPDTAVTEFAEGLTQVQPRASDRATPLSQDAPTQIASRARRFPLNPRWSRVGTTVGVFLALALGFYLLRSPQDSAQAATSGLRPTPSVVILPFNPVDSQGSRYFLNGIRSGIRDRLAGIGQMAVSFTAGHQHESGSTGENTPNNGHGVNTYALRASVQERRSATEDSVVVNSSLVRLSDGGVVWTQSYLEPVHRLFWIESDVARSVVRATGATMLVSEANWVDRVPTTDFDAYDLYLHGLDFLDAPNDRGRGWTAFGPDADLFAAAELFDEAIQLEPSFVEALARLAITHTSLYFWNFDRSPRRLEQARRSAERAMELRPDLPVVHLASAWFYYLGNRNYDRALRHFEAANTNWSGQGEAALLIGAVRRRQGDFAAAADLYRAAEGKTSECAECAAELSYTLFALGQYTDAMSEAQRAIRIAPELHLPRHVAALASLRQGVPVERAAAFLQATTGRVDDIVHLATGRWAVLHRIIGGSMDAALQAVNLQNQGVRDTAGVLIAKAEMAARYGRTDSGAVYFDRARVWLEDRREIAQFESREHAALGMAYAGLGRAVDAIREGVTAVRLLPVSRDALDGPLALEALAAIYTMVGDFDAAVEQLEVLAAIPSWITPEILSRDPRWEPLRRNARFTKLVGPRSAPDG